MTTVLNKKAKYDYLLYDKFEAGVVLTGAEVKSVKEGSVSLVDSYVRVIAGEVHLVNAYISPYKFALDPSYDPKRERKLLLNKSEVDFLVGKTSSSSLTIVPTKVYTKHNLAKVEISLARARKKADKREVLKKRAVERDAQAELRGAKLKAQRQLKIE
jgi:SsrA-binding protein